MPLILSWAGLALSFAQHRWQAYPTHSSSKFHVGVGLLSALIHLLFEEWLNRYRRLCISFAWSWKTLIGFFELKWPALLHITCIKGKVPHLHQEPFQAATLEDCCLLELCLSGTVTNSGWPKRRAQLLHKGAVLMYILFSLPVLCHCSSFYYPKFIKEEAEKFTSQVQQALIFLKRRQI